MGFSNFRPSDGWPGRAVRNFRRKVLTALSGCVLVGALTGMSTAGATEGSTAAVPTFDIVRYRVEGATIFDHQTIDALLAPFTGTRRDFGTVQQAVDALEKAYTRRGYNAIQVLVPEQELTGGVVTLRVIESRIGTVTLEGNRFFDSGNIRGSLPALQEGTVPNLTDISASLRVANENPAKKTSLQLQNAADGTTINALLKVSDERPWRAGLSFDDKGNDQTGNYRLGILLEHANLFNLDHLLTLQFITSPDHFDKVKIYGVGYRIPWYRMGDSIDLFGGYSDVDSGTVTSGTLDVAVSGKGYFGGVRYNQNLRRIGSYEHRLVYGADYRNYQSNVTAAGVPLDTEVLVHPLSITYTGAWNFAGVGTSFYISGAQNFPGGSKGENDDFRKARSGASATYTVGRFGGEIDYSLPRDWLAGLRVNSQYAGEPLVPGEQFGLGGAASVRGFDERELTGDSGVSGSVEMYTPDMCQSLVGHETRCRALAFYDLGYAARNGSQPGEKSDAAIAGTGVGLRFSVGNWFSVGSDYAFVVRSGGTRQWGDSRWHLKASLTF